MWSGFHRSFINNLQTLKKFTIRLFSFLTRVDFSMFWNDMTLPFCRNAVKNLIRTVDLYDSKDYAQDEELIILLKMKTHFEKC